MRSFAPLSFFLLWLAVSPVCAAAAMANPVAVVALGDSLTAGYGLDPADGFVPQLQKALAAEGLAVEIQNAGVSGDTTAQGLARLDWSVPEGTRAVILELGANDALRGQDPAAAERNLDAILARLAERRIPVLLAGMKAPPNMGADYREAFDAIFPRLAARHGVALYPFFLEGVAGNAALIQPDGLHPNAQGVQIIVKSILPAVRALLRDVGG